MIGRLDPEIVRMNARLCMGLPALVQDAESGEVIATTDRFMRKDHFYFKPLRPISKPLADGLILLMQDTQPALDEIHLVLNHARQIDDFQTTGRTADLQRSSWIDEEIKSAHWRSQISMMICHHLDWPVLLETQHRFGAQLLYQSAVWSELQRREMCQLPVLNPKLLRELPVDLLTEVVKHTLVSVIGTARKIYREEELPPAMLTPFFRYGMAQIDDKLDDLMIEVRRLHHMHVGMVPPERLKELGDLIKKYFTNRNGQVAPNPAWHFKRFTMDIKEHQSTSRL